MVGDICLSKHDRNNVISLIEKLLDKPSLAAWKRLIEVTREYSQQTGYRLCAYLPHPCYGDLGISCTSCPLYIDTDFQSDGDICDLCTTKLNRHYNKFWKTHQGIIVLGFTKFLIGLQEQENENG